MDHGEQEIPDEPTQTPSTYVGYDINDKNVFRGLSLNVQSMNNKFDAIRRIADSTGTSILALQEVWGQNPTTGYSIKGYHKPEIVKRIAGGMIYLVRVAPDCNRSYCEDSFSGYSGSV